MAILIKFVYPLTTIKNNEYIHDNAKATYCLMFIQYVAFKSIEIEICFLKLHSILVFSIILWILLKATQLSSTLSNTQPELLFQF
jgi:hypothetical protein